MKHLGVIILNLGQYVWKILFKDFFLFIALFCSVERNPLCNLSRGFV